MRNICIIACLNKQQKIYNLLKGQILGGIVAGFVGGAFGGLLFGFGAAAIGFMLGGNFENNWFRGKLQRWAYWYLPLKQFLGLRHLPDADFWCER
jgi:hypothetical protein